MHGLRAGVALAGALALAGCFEDGSQGEPVDAAVDAAPDAMPAPDAAADMAGPDMAAPDMAAPDMAIADALAPDAGPPPGRFEAVDLCLAGVLDASGATGAAVAIVEGGELVHAAGIGHRNDADETPVAPSTLFRFGSTLKGMTALAVFTEIEQGDIAAETAAAEVLPPLAEHADPRWQDLTVHHLLTHQGGMADYIALQEPGDPDSVLGEVVEGEAFAESAFFMVDPGTFYNYSNPNFMLAGRVLEVLTGESYRAAMQRLVFEPLRMQRVVFRPADVVADGDYALGSTAGAFPGMLRRVPAEEYDSVWTRPAGLGWASVLDLAHYVRYVMEGRPLGDDLDPEPWLPPVTPETWQVWRSPQVPAESFGVEVEYGHGLIHEHGLWIDRSWYPVELVGHGGNITGYTSVLVTAPELGLGATVLANGDALNNQLLGCLIPMLAASDDFPPAAEAPDRAPDPTTYADYVGEYVGGPNIGPISVAQTEAGGLELTLPLVDEANIPYEPALIPIARDMFIAQIQGFQIPLSGIRPAPGEPVQYLRTRFFVGQRAEPEEVAVQKRAIDIEPLLRRLARAHVLSEPAPVTAMPRAH